MNSIRRVLIVYSSKPPTIDYLKSAFARRGIQAEGVYADENTLFDRFVIHRLNKLAHNLRVIPKSKKLFEDHSKSHMNYRSASLRSTISRFDPDLLFLIRGFGFRPWAYESARMKFSWWVESDERVGEALNEVPDFDWYFFINSSSVEAAHMAGHSHVSYLPHAVDSSVFRPMPGVAKDVDFSFAGLWSEKRQRFVEAALDVSSNGVVYGPKWYKKTFNRRRLQRIVKGSYIGGDELVRLYNRSKIVINVTNWGANQGINRSGMTMRLFEVPATRSFLLTDESVETKVSMMPGRHIETFSDIHDFQEKIRFYLDNDAARERIAGQGMEQVRANCSYDKMVDTIIDAYQQVESGKLPARLGKQRSRA